MMMMMMMTTSDADDKEEGQDVFRAMCDLDCGDVSECDLNQGT